MIDVCSGAVVAAITLVLDTRPPGLVIAAPSSVDPPEDWVVDIVADEPIGAASLSFEDAVGIVSAVGYEQIDDTHLRVVVPTVGLASDAGRLVGWVTDEVANVASVSVDVMVRRPVAFEAPLTIGHAFDVAHAAAYSYSAAVMIEPSVEVASTFDHAYEVIETITGSFDVEVTIRAHQ